MNEGQMYDAAEREMDLYRAEITRITAARDDYAARLKAVDESWAKVAAERDGAYRERARLVAFLAACYPSVIMHDADDDAPGWSVIFIDTPTGQMSWHLAEGDLDLFRHVAKVLKHYPSPWDGHTTEQKYERLAELIPHATDDREQVRLARADRDQLRGQVLSLAADLEESAARTAPSKKSSIESEIAIRLRKTAGPPS